METITKIANKNYLVDTKANQITFLDNRFYQTPSGTFVPSVTTILQAYPKTAAFFEWLKQVGENADEIRDEAGRRGSVVHALTEAYDNGDTVSLMDEDGNIRIKMREWAMFEKYVFFRVRCYDWTPIAVEMNVISELLGFAGTLDRLFDANEHGMVLVDIKTSNAIYPEYFLQLAAYKRLLEELGTKVDKCAILWLNARTKTDGKKGSIQGTGWQIVWMEDEPRQWSLFQATHRLWLAENATLQPKQLVYSLTHKK